MGDIGRTIGGTRSVLAVMRSPSQRDEFTEFVRARSSALHRAAYLMVGDVGLAEDLVQEALAKTYVAWPRIRDKRAAEAYARKVVTTTAISWFRRKAWKGERADEQVPEGGHGDHAVDVAEQTRLWAALLELPVRQRTAIVLRTTRTSRRPRLQPRWAVRSAPSRARCRQGWSSSVTASAMIPNSFRPSITWW